MQCVQADEQESGTSPRQCSWERAGCGATSRGSVSPGSRPRVSGPSFYPVSPRSCPAPRCQLPASGACGSSADGSAGAQAPGCFSLPVSAPHTGVSGEHLPGLGQTPNRVRAWEEDREVCDVLRKGAASAGVREPAQGPLLTAKPSPWDGLFLDICPQGACGGLLPPPCPAGAQSRNSCRGGGWLW